jgi:sugar phosphate isomerase/epimerase
MQLGVYASPEDVPMLAQAGFDYVEISVVRDLQPEVDLDGAGTRLAAVEACALPTPVACIFLPGSFKLTGPDVDEPTLERYARTAFTRAEQAGVEIVVFGSGGARRIPDGFDREQGWDQLVRFGRMIGPIAADHGVTAAVEPLRHAECNVLNTVAESAGYVREVNHPGVQLLVDAYHWAQNGEPAASIIDAGPLLVHAHIATYENRLSPGQEPCDFQPFFDALRAAKYGGRLSIEARWEIDESSAQSAFAALRKETA